MPDPVTVDIPHQLGREEAKRRIEDGVGNFADLVPGGSIARHEWMGDTLHFVVTALGQSLDCRLDAEEKRVVATFVLPPMLAPFADAIRRKLQKEAPKLLEER